MSIRKEEKERLEDKEQTDWLISEATPLSTSRKINKLVQPWLEPGYLDIEKVSFDKNNNQLLVEFINSEQVEFDLALLEVSKEVETVELLSSGMAKVLYRTEASDDLVGISGMYFSGSKIREFTDQGYSQHLLEEEKQKIISFGKMMKEFRQFQKITFNQIEDQTGITVQRTKDIEAGKSRPTWEEMDNIFSLSGNDLKSFCNWSCRDKSSEVFNSIK